MERYHYRLLVGFDDRETNDYVRTKYFGFVDKYKASAVGNLRTHNSEVCFFSERELTQGDLEAELGTNIPITQFIKVRKDK